MIHTAQIPWTIFSFKENYAWGTTL